MTAKAFVVSPETYPRPFNVVGEQVTVLASGTATGGYEIFLQDGPEGSGPVPHSHPWDESFFVTRGEVDFSIDGAQQTACAGTLVHLPAGTTHAFRFRQGGATMVSMTSRLGASSMFAELDCEIAPDQPDLPKLVQIARQHGLTIAEPG
jgi:quercetin dioxygenase-like cupin family protein